MYTLYAINEAKFKSVEDAKNAYNKLQKDDDFFDWFKTFLRSFIILSFSLLKYLKPHNNSITKYFNFKKQKFHKLENIEKIFG